LAHASHISSQLASNATDSPPSTRSLSVTVHSVASASTKAAAERCETATPFGAPVEPEVKMIHASSSGVAAPTAPPVGARTVTVRPGPMTAHAPQAFQMVSARESGSSASTGT
jgi:hypothetical protein